MTEFSLKQRIQEFSQTDTGWPTTDNSDGRRNCKKQQRINKKAQISFKTIRLSKKPPSVKPYKTPRIKLRNFFSNIAYVGITKEEFYNQDFCIWCLCSYYKKSKPFCVGKKNWLPKQARNDVHALERMGAQRIL